MGAATVLTISGGAVTVTNLSNYRIAGEGGVADILTTINGGTTGQVIMLRASDTTVTITIDDAADNILCGGADFALDSSKDRILLQYDGVDWVAMAAPANNA
jgi:hypothetical protein